MSHWLQGAAGEEESSREALVEISNPIEDTEAFTEGSCYIVTDLTAPDRSRSSLPSAVLIWDTKRTLWEKIPPLEAQEA